MTLEREIGVDETRPHEEDLLDRAMVILETDQLVGICRACGAETEPVEPDVEDYECPECGALELSLIHI